MTGKKKPIFVIEDNIIKAEKLPLPQKNEYLNEILLENLKKNPEFVGQVDAKTGETCTYRKLADESIRCAIWMRKQGLVPGDIISICSHNNIASWVPFCATFYIGGNLNPWYHDWSPDTARYFVNLTKPKVIFANEHAGVMLGKVLKEENIESKIVIFGNVAGFESFDDIIKKQSVEEVENFQCHPVHPDDDALMLFSSGSTGLPKGVQHSYRGVHYNIHKFSCTFQDAEQMVSMFSSSLYWISGTLCTLRCLLSTSRAIVVDSPSPEELCRNIEKFKVQWIFVGTGIINQLFKSDDVLTKFDLSSVKYILTGGSKVRAEVTNRINKVLTSGEILQGYGLTELGGVAVLQERGHNNHESCGIVTKDTKLKIVDVDNNSKEILGPNEKGEILLKQTYMMKFYFQNSKATQEAIDDEGWLHTGDLGHYDSKGNVYIVGRIKEVIKYRGHQISPIEIESILVKHPEILDAAVVPVPHSIDDEHPMAFVVKRKNSKVSKDELVSLVSVLGDTKKLRGGIVFLEKFPQTPSGKINKSKLKEMAMAYSS